VNSLCLLYSVVLFLVVIYVHISIISFFGYFLDCIFKNPLHKVNERTVETSKCDLFCGSEEGVGQKPAEKWTTTFAITVVTGICKLLSDFIVVALEVEFI
jgi:hypothetical protein